MDGTPTPTILAGDDQPAAPENNRAVPVGPARVFGWCAAGALGVLLVALAATMVYALRALLVQIVIAVFIAISLDPVVRWMILRRVKRSHAVAVIFLVLLVAIAALVWTFVPGLIEQANKLGTDFPGYVHRLVNDSPTLSRIEARFHLQSRVDAWLQQMPGQVGAQALAFTRRFFGAVVSVLLVLVMTIYLMLDLPRLRRGLVRLFPKPHRPQVSEAVNILIDKVGSYMIGNILISGIAGLAAFVALTALRVPFSLPLALLVAVADMIPLVGATAGAAVCLVVSAATSELWPTTVLVAIFFVVYQQVENYLVVPRVMRNTVQISSIAVLFAALVGANVLGLVGALMAIPVVAAARVILSERLRLRDEAVERPSATIEPVCPRHSDAGAVRPAR